MVHQGLVRGHLFSVKEKETIAKRMRSSRNYTKIFQLPAIQQMVKNENDDSNDIRAVDETDPYDRQRARARSY